jgi:hemerythrin superfamily protein
MPEHNIDVVTQVTADHRAVEALLADLEAGRGDRGAVIQVIVRELSLHAGVEELVVYPVVQAEVEGGEELNQTDLEQHQKLKEVLARLDGADPALVSTAADLEAVQRLVQEHVEHEERQVLPKLENEVSAPRRAELGDLFLKAKAKAPTHPHPRAPNTPPLNAVADAVAAVVDRARDTLSRFVRT